jgi:chitinase
MLLSTVVTIAITFLAAAPQKIVGYFPSWAPSQSPAFTWKEIDYSQVTHICWSFGWPDSTNGNLAGITVQDARNIDSLVARSHANGVKVLLSLGGGGMARTFPKVATTPALRAKFCHNVKTFLASHQLDGADMDWEWEATPPASDTAGYRLLVRELRDSLGRNLLLTAAMPASDWWAKWMPVAGIVDAMDWLGIMTYDMTGDWDTQSGYNSPLFNNPRSGIDHDVADLSVSSAMTYWSVKRAVPKSKLLFGQPFYGVRFAKGTTPGAAFSGSAVQEGYAEVSPQFAGWTRHWDDTAKANWATTSSGEYVSWDDPRTTAMKARWAKDNGYAGAIVWELSQDWSPNAGHPMLDSLARILLENPSSTAPSRKFDNFRLVLDRASMTARISGAHPRRLDLLDLEGRIVRTAPRHGDLIELDLHGLRPGLYLVRGSSDGMDRTAPWVVTGP